MTKIRRKKRVHMKQLREIFRLTFNCNRTSRDIANMLNLSPSTVNKYLSAYKKLNLAWKNGLEDLSEWDLQQHFKIISVKESITKDILVTPDFNYIHKELKRKGVTLLLLWEEYKEQNTNKAYSRSQYCCLYKAWKKRLKVTMRQTHKAGDKLFIDYCGPTINITDTLTGEIKKAQIFIGVMGASNYTYAEATWTQTMPDWIASHIRMFDFFGGVPALLIPDNLKSGVIAACRYDPTINSSYLDLASHYDTAIMPARPRKPRDKAKAEAGVLLVERWIMAKLRNFNFFTLSTANKKIQELLVGLNNKQFQKMDGSRKSQFELLDKPELKALPLTKHEYAEEKYVKLHIDYHFEIKGHYYSAPYTLAGKTLTAKYTASKVVALYNGKKVAIHVRNYKRGAHTTLPEHMPEKHKKHLTWSVGRFSNWASSIGPETSMVVEALIKKKKHPEQSYRSCLGLLNLSKTYSNTRLEVACGIAIKLNSTNRANIAEILKNGMDKVRQKDDKEDGRTVQDHKNIRGSEYFANENQEV